MARYLFCSICECFHPRHCLHSRKLVRIELQLNLFVFFFKYRLIARTLIPPTDTFRLLTTTLFVSTEFDVFKSMSYVKLLPIKTFRLFTLRLQVVYIRKHKQTPRQTFVIYYFALIHTYRKFEKIFAINNFLRILHTLECISNNV